MNARSLRRRLKVKDLELLIAIEEGGNLQRAAERLATSQPALSRSLAQIEALLGVQLFERSARGTVPTAYGASLVRYARQCIDMLDHASDELAAMQSGALAHLCIGSNYSSSATVLPQTLARLKQQAPHVRVSVREGALNELLPELRAHRLDVVIARLGPLEEPQLYHCEVLAEEGMCVVCRKGHPLARRKRLDWADLAGYPWILPPQGSPTRHKIDAALLRLLDRPAPCWLESSSLLLNVKLLAASDALATFPSSAAVELASQGVFHRLPLAFPEAFDPLGIILLRQRRAVPGLSTLLACLREAVATGGRHEGTHARLSSP